ncbi:MAG: BCCT family transporter, partial [Rhodococcus sp. (in: high G+C Gram-positive bacteria)]
ALATGGLTVAMLLVGGVGALQNAAVIMGLPFAFVIILVMIGLYRSLRVETFRIESVEQSLPGSLSVRTGGNRGVDWSWRHRLSRVLRFPGEDRVREFGREVVLPSFNEVVEEMQAQGIDARCGPVDAAEDMYELVVGADHAHPFRYQV